MVRMAFSSVAIASCRSVDWVFRNTSRSRAAVSSSSAARFTGPSRATACAKRLTSLCSHDGLGRCGSAASDAFSSARSAEASASASSICSAVRRAACSFMRSSISR